MSDSLFLQDFYPGQMFVSEPFTLTADDLVQFGDLSGDRHPMHTPGARPPGEVIGHGPFGIARYFGTVYASGVLAETVIAGLDTHWYFRAPLLIGAELHYETLITGWRRSSDPSRGVLHRHIRLLDATGRVVQEGSAAVLVRAGGQPIEEDPPSALPLSLPWANAVVRELENTSAFRDATQLFDGAIGLASDAAQVQLRIYKGQIIDVTKRTPAGATFTVRGDAQHWCGLLTGDRNDFIIRANRDEFQLIGDAYTYLQMTKALHLLIDAGRIVTATGAQQ